MVPAGVEKKQLMKLLEELLGDLHERKIHPFNEDTKRLEKILGDQQQPKERWLRCLPTTRTGRAPVLSSAYGNLPMGDLHALLTANARRQSA